MQELQANDILTIWEQGRSQSPTRRALAMLAAANPNRELSQLALLPLGDRNIQLLKLREITFGRALESVADCAQCGEKLEFRLDTAALRGEGSLKVSGDLPAHHTVELGELTCKFRLPNSEDLLVLERCSDRDTAYQLLVERCVLALKHGERALSVSDTWEEIAPKLGSQIAQLDPQAEIVINLTCPSCQHQWPLLFDIAEFFWKELVARAQRLLWEVHCLASAYGWREADILAMSPQRRWAYLEVGSHE